MKHAKRQFFGIPSTIFAIVVGLFVLTSCSDHSPVDVNDDSDGEQVIQWNYNGKATAEGSGCHTFDTIFVDAGNQISIIFSNLVVELTGLADSKEVDEQACHLIIPVRIKAGWYIEEMKQTLFYGYIGTEGTGGEVALQSLLGDNAAGEIRRSIPTPGSDSLDIPYIEATVNSTFGPDQCSQSDITALYKTELTVRGFRENLSKSIVIQIDGLDIRFDRSEPCS